MQRLLIVMALVALTAVGTTLAGNEREGPTEQVEFLFEPLFTFPLPDGHLLMIERDRDVHYLAGALAECVGAAVATCGEGEVCWVRVTNQECYFACRDREGNCPDPPRL